MLPSLSATFTAPLPPLVQQRSGASASPETFKIFSNTVQDVLVYMAKQASDQLLPGHPSKTPLKQLGIYTPQQYLEQSIQQLEKSVRHIEPHVLSKMERVKSNRWVPRIIQTPPAHGGLNPLSSMPHNVYANSYESLMQALSQAHPRLHLTNPRKKLPTKSNTSENPGLRFNLGVNRIVLKASEFKSHLNAYMKTPLDAQHNLFGVLPHNIEHAQTKEDLLRGPLDNIV